MVELKLDLEEMSHALRVELLSLFYRTAYFSEKSFGGVVPFEFVARVHSKENAVEE